MKILLSSIAAFLALSAIPASAGTDGRTDYDYFVQQVDAAEAAWRSERPTKPFWQDIKSTLPSWTDAQGAQKERLERAINDLIERAQHAQLIQSDFWRMKAMIIDAKCCTEVRILWKQAKNRDATRQQFEYVANLLEERAEAAKEQPDLRQKLQDGINELMKKYLGGATLTELETDFYDDETVRSMLERAITWLEDMAVKRHATREQFEYVSDLMKDRARVWSEDLEMAALVRRVEAEIERLKNPDFAPAGYTRDHFLKLREMCLKKAREVVSPVGTPG